MTAAEIWMVVTEKDALTVFYAQSLRASLFSGFLTLAGFLFTVKTFLIIRLQQDIYGDESYQDWVRIGRKYNENLTIYGPLRRLGRWLFRAVWVSFAAAISQLTIGLLEQRWSTLVSLGIAIAAAVVFVATLVIVRGVIRSWIDYEEEAAEKRLAKADAEKAAAESAKAG